jgi:uncharacterized protein (DUF58 family)
MGQPYIKRYIAERELTVLLVVDVSGSMQFGTGRLTARTVATELAALITLAAVEQNDRVGLYCYTDSVITRIPPARGPRHAVRLLELLIHTRPRHPGTNLNAALNTLNRQVRRRVVVFLLSDFVGWTDTRQVIQRTAKQHELIAVPILPQFEAQLPDAGLIVAEDLETGHQTTIDTSAIQGTVRATAQANETALLAFLRACRADCVPVGTMGQHFKIMLDYFQSRAKRQARP